MNQLVVSRPLQDHASHLIVIGHECDNSQTPHRHHASWETFLQSGEQPLGFYLHGHTTEQQLHLALEIRRSSYWDLPIYIGENDPPCELADRHGTPDQALRDSKRFAAAKQSLALPVDTLNDEERLLYWLYLRESAELRPVRDRTAKGLYRYPVAEALAQDSADADERLSTLVRRRLLEPVQLTDRTRHCRDCGAAHFHYLDVCPHCTSIEIHKQPSLHCFTCGHVGRQDDFRTEGGVVCPNCSTRLRHIGVDYDRPLTQYVCDGCGTSAIETAVVARCLYCDATHQPDALEVHEVCTLRLSAHGRAALRAGQISESFAALDVVNFVVPNYFRTLIDWALVTQRRHKQLEFSLLLVEFRNAVELIEAHGAQRTYLMLDEFASRLHELLRNSDLTTRTSEERLWLFLPFSSAAGLAARIEKFLAEQAPVDGPALRVALRHLSAPEMVRPDDTAEDLMARLADESAR